MMTPVDSHIHTHLSGCAVNKDFYFRPADVIDRAVETGIKVVGISNHMWDIEAGNNKGHYIGDDFAHILTVFGDIPADTRGVKVLVGCETDYSYQEGLGITAEHAAMLDYITVPCAHFHLTNLTLPAPMTKPCEFAELLVRRMHDVCDEPLVDIITHCFAPKGTDKMDGTQLDILKALNIRDVEECFAHAAQKNKAIEIHASFLPAVNSSSDYAVEVQEYFLEYIRMAKNCGCKFTLGSDAHTKKEMGRTVKMAEVVSEKTSLCDDDVLNVFKM